MAAADVEIQDVVFFPEGEYVQTSELLVADPEDTQGLHYDHAWCRGVAFRVKGNAFVHLIGL